jgi:hypothetical protein
VVIAPEMAGRRAASELAVKLRVSPFFVPGEQAWIAVSNDSPILQHADAMFAAIEKMERAGVMENLMREYLEQQEK